MRLKVELRQNQHPLVFNADTQEDLTNRCAEITHLPGSKNHVIAVIFRLNEDGHKYVDEAAGDAAKDLVRVVQIIGGFDER